MDGTIGEGVSGSNTWAVAALVLGIVGIPTFCLVVPALLAVIFGILAMRGSNTGVGPQSGRGMAIAGLIMGLLSIAVALLFYARVFR